MRNLGTIATPVLLALLVCPVAKPQGMPPVLGMGGNEGPDGLHFYGVSVYAEYTSTVIPFGSNLAFSAGVPPGLPNLGPNYLGGIVARVGWRKTGARTNFYIAYAPSYDVSFKYSSLDSLNHNLMFGLIHDLGPKWTIVWSGAAVTARFDQFLFEPTVFASLAGTPATFDELSQAILSGTYTNPQLASILTGAPLIESPATTLIYGPRFLDASLRTDISYRHSERLRYHFGVSTTRTQGLNSGQLETDGVRVLPQTTAANAATGLIYAFSPVTTFGVEMSASRIFSRFEDVYVANGTLLLNRVLGRRWIAQVHGGAGFVTPIQHIFAYPPGTHYLAGATLTYKTLAHTFMASYNHTIADAYGLGAYSSSTAFGAWNWHIPGRTWAVVAGGSYESLSEIGSHNLNAWLGDAGINRRFGLHTMAQLAYIYGRTSGVVADTPEKRSLQGVRLVLSWSPFLPLGF